MRIAVVGAGGVGGYFGARFAAAGEETWFIARGPHLDAMKTRGLEVRSVDGDLRLDEVAATDDARDVGPCDVVLFCVKSFDSTTAAEDHLPHLVGEHTAVVSLQNGVDNVQRIAAVIGGEHAVGGLAFIFSGVVEPGIVAHTGGPGRLLFGEMDGSASPRTTRFLETCRVAGIDAAIPPDILVAMWDKFAFICAQAGTTAAVRLPIGDIRDTPETWELFRALVEETYAVARAVGVGVADGAIDERLAFAESLQPELFSSLHDDLVAGRPMELAGLHGVVVRLAERHGIEVPKTAAVHAILAPWAARNARQG